MADAWGGSWGSSWGVSWGAGVVPPTPPQDFIAVGFPGKDEEYRKRRAKQQEIEDAVERAFDAVFAEPVLASEPLPAPEKKEIARTAKATIETAGLIASLSEIEKQVAVFERERRKRLKQEQDDEELAVALLLS